MLFHRPPQVSRAITLIFFIFCTFHEPGETIMNLGKLRKLIPARILLVGLLSLLILIPLSSATGVQYANLTRVGNVHSSQLTEQSQGFLFSGGYLLWSGGNEALSLYSLKDNSTRTLKTGSNDYTLSDGTVGWSDDSGLHQYTVSSGNDHVIPDTNTTGSQKTYSWNGFKSIQRWEPSMYGDRVVWFQGYPEGTYRAADIAFLNTTTNVLTLISESPTGKDGLVINGDNVIWCAYDENVTDAGTHNTLFLHNLVTGKDTVVSSAPGLKRQDVLSGDYVGWTDFGDPLATPQPLRRVHTYTISSGTAQAVSAASMDQELDFIAGDYAFYSECTPYDTKTGERTCNPKIFDIKTGSTLQLPPSLSGRQIIGYSNGLLLVEDTSGNIPELSLFRTENLPAIETVAATPAPATPGVPGENVTSLAGTAPPVTPTLKSPGFAFPGMIVALVIFCGIAGRTARPPRRS
jgi:hypothetical protein